MYNFNLFRAIVSFDFKTVCEEVPANPNRMFAGTYGGPQERLGNSSIFDFFQAFTKIAKLEEAKINGIAAIHVATIVAMQDERGKEILNFLLAQPNVKIEADWQGSPFPETNALSLAVRIIGTQPILEHQKKVFSMLSIHMPENIVELAKKLATELKRDDVLKLIESSIKEAKEQAAILPGMVDETATNSFETMQQQQPLYLYFRIEQETKEQKYYVRDIDPISGKLIEKPFELKVCYNEETGQHYFYKPGAKIKYRHHDIIEYDEKDAIYVTVIPQPVMAIKRLQPTLFVTPSRSIPSSSSSMTQTLHTRSFVKTSGLYSFTTSTPNGSNPLSRRPSVQRVSVAVHSSAENTVMQPEASINNTGNTAVTQLAAVPNNMAKQPSAESSKRPTVSACCIIM